MISSPFGSRLFWPFTAPLTFPPSFGRPDTRMEFVRGFAILLGQIRDPCGRGEIGSERCCTSRRRESHTPHAQAQATAKPSENHRWAR